MSRSITRKAVQFWTLLLLMTAAAAHGQTYAAFNGACTLGNQSPVTNGALSAGTKPMGSTSSTPLVRGGGVVGSYPQCTVTVYATGTLTLANPLYTTASGGTVLSNPFTAGTDGSVLFYAASACYDIVLSAGVTAASQMPTTKTLSDVCIGGGGGGGGGPVAISGGVGISTTPSPISAAGTVNLLPALPNGETASTQPQGDASLDVANDQFVMAALSSTKLLPQTGCGVEAIAGTLNVSVGACLNYTINNLQYSSPLTTVTLATADPTNPRLDLIGVNTSGAVFVVTGTPAVNPVAPAPDPSTQFALTNVLVPATATSPSLTVVDIYHDGTQWTPTNVGAPINTLSTANPYNSANPKSIEGTAATTGNYAQLTDPSAGTVTLSNYNNLVFYIASKAAWPSTRSISVQWFSGATAVGNPVLLGASGTFGFNSALTIYQQVSIPTALFGTGATAVNNFRLTISGSGATIGFYVGDVTLQGGAASGSGSAFMNWRGAWNNTSAYNVNDVVTYFGTSYVALTANTNVAPFPSGANWAFMTGMGTNQQVIFNNSGLLQGDSGMLYNIATKAFTVGGSINVSGSGAGLITALEGTCSIGTATLDAACASSVIHRWVFNNNAGTTLTFPGTSTTPATSGHLAVYGTNGYDIQDGGAPGSSAPVLWQRQGTILSPPSSDNYTDAEPSVIYEGSPQVLTSSAKVFKMWFSGGWANGGFLYYAESNDGVSGWTRYGSSLINGCVHSWVFKNSTTYHAYCGNTVGGTHIDHYTSSNGISWTLSAASVITLSQSWEGSQIGNIAVVINGSTWVALVEALSTDNIWRTGWWTSTDGAGNVWTGYSGNPVIPTNGMSSTGNCGGPYLTLQSGTYYAWLHCNGSNGTGTGNLPDDIYEFSSTNGTTWTQTGTLPVLARATLDEGMGLTNGQVADPFIVEANSHTYLYYEGTQNGSAQQANPVAGQHLKVAVSSVPLATLVTSTQLDASTYMGVPLLQTNSANNSTQAFFNLVAGSGVNLSESNGTITITVSGCPSGDLDFANFIGASSTPVSSYTDNCGNSFILYSNDGASPTIPVLNGSGSAILSGGTYGDALGTLAPATANYTVSATFTTTTNSMGLFSRASSAANTNYFLGCTAAGASSTCTMYKQIAGTPTQLGSVYTFTWTSGTTHTIALKANGTSISALVDGSTVIGPVTDSAISSAGQAGFRVTTATTCTNYTVTTP